MFTLNRFNEFSEQNHKKLQYIVKRILYHTKGRQKEKRKAEMTNNLEMCLISLTSFSLTNGDKEYYEGNNILWMEHGESTVCTNCCVPLSRLQICEGFLVSKVQNPIERSQHVTRRVSECA